MAGRVGGVAPPTRYRAGEPEREAACVRGGSRTLSSPAAMRSVLALAAGFVVIAGLSSGVDALLWTLFPDAYDADRRLTSAPLLLLTQALVGACAVAGCTLAGRLAPGRPMHHALILGALGLAAGVAGSLALWSTAPVWYHVLGWALVLPCAWLGGRISERTRPPSPTLA